MGIWREAYVIKIYSGRSDNDKKETWRAVRYYSPGTFAFTGSAG